MPPHNMSNSFDYISHLYYGLSGQKINLEEEKPKQEQHSVEKDLEEFNKKFQ